MSGRHMDSWQSIHQPVMVSDVLRFLAVRPGGTYCDATLGLGGHSAEIVAQLGESGLLLGIDRDETALQLATARLSSFGARFRAMHGRFGDLAQQLAAEGIPALDGIVADLGVSSLQLDRAERGFSFQARGPIDMRMDRGCGETALEAIVRLDEQKLAAILAEYGEERHSARIARVLKNAATENRLRDTQDIADLVARVVPHKEPHKHPATRTFQALRIFVNDELRQIHSLLLAAPDLLVPGGRLVILSFHSLEDRLVKQHFAFSDRVAQVHSQRGFANAHKPFVELFKGALTPSVEEVRRNPRARSARLRAARTWTLEERAAHTAAKTHAWPR